MSIISSSFVLLLNCLLFLGAKVRQKRQPVVTQIAVELSQIAEDDRNSPLSAMLRRLSVSGRRRPARRHRRRSGRVSVSDRESGQAWDQGRESGLVITVFLVKELQHSLLLLEQVIEEM